MTLVLITGGVRAGKSDFAERLARTLGGDDVLYLATAEAGDGEMAERIARHRARRPAGWRTVEAPLGLAAALGAQPPAKVVLLDCLTLLVSNVLLAHGEEAGEDAVWPAVEAEVNGLLAWATAAGCVLVLVTNEVGLGVVPPTRLGRTYRDLLGRANQLLAERAAEVYLLVSGIPIELKRLVLGLRERWR